MNINSSQLKFKRMSNVDQNPEFKGTPGPWKVSKHCNQLIVNPDAVRHNSVCSLDVTPTRSKAELELAIENARAISAAPELIRLLIDLRRFWNQTDEPVYGDLRDRTDLLLTKILDDDTRPTFD